MTVGTGRLRIGPCLAGLALVAAFLSLADSVGFRATLGGPFLFVGWEEGLFWVSHYSLAVPGLLLLGYGAAPVLGPFLRRWAQRFLAAPSSTWRLMGVLYALVLFTAAVVGRGQLLLHMPITDDESGVLFGARMVAEGHLRVPMPEPRRAFPMLFIFERDGYVSSMDFPGGILFAAACLLTGLGSLPYAGLAAAGGFAVAFAAGTAGGRRAALAAGALWLFSPMVLSLSYTTHPQLLSRSWIALAVAAYCSTLRARPQAAVVPAAALGLTAGIAFLCRPFESACVLGPAAAHLGVLALRRPGFRKRLAAAFALWSISAATFAWYNAQITGRWYVQARFASDLSSLHPSPGSVVHNLGVNVGFNLTMLSVWLIGPLAAPLIFVSLRRRTPLHRVLGAAVFLQLLLGLGHDNSGIHSVGPIHYSESAVPLTLLASFGLVSLWDRLPRGRDLALSLVAMYVVGLGLFNGLASLTLRDQARILRTPLDAIERAGIHDAVVVADPPHVLWDLRPEMAEIRSWMVQFPHPDPFLRDDVLLVYPSVPAELLVARFPNRTFYRLTYREEGDPIDIVRLVPRGDPTISSPYDGS